MQPGEALELENFEPDVEGGYRRINGFSKYLSAVVPQTSSSTEQVLMVATFGDLVVAARGEKNIDNKNKKPTVTDVNPVFPPASTPAELST